MTSMITETLAITGPLHREAEWIKKRSHKHKHTQKNDICGLTHLWEVPYLCVSSLFPNTHMHVRTHTHTHIYINLASSRSDAILVLALLLDPPQQNKLCLADLR